MLTLESLHTVAASTLRLRAIALALRGPPTISNSTNAGCHRPPLQFATGLPHQSGADCLAEALGIRRSFGKDDVIVDEKCFLDVLRTGGLQFLDRFRKKINGRFAADEEFRLSEHNRREANRGDDLTGSRHRCDKFLKLFVVP